MSPRDFLTTLIDTLRTNRLRTGLTMFGITWGVAFALIMGGISDGLRNAFVEEIERFGLYEVFLWPGRMHGEVGGYRAGRNLRFDDRTLGALRQHSPSLWRVSPQIWAGFAEVKFGNRVRSFPINGVEATMHDIRRFPAARGRRLNDEDVRASRRVCFIGSNVHKRLFGQVDPIGQRVRINNRSFIVVGVAEPKADSLFRSGWQDNDLVLIPASTARRVFTGGRHYEMLVMQATSREASYALVEETRRVLGALHGFPHDDRDALSFFNTVDNVMQVLKTQQSSQVFGTVVIFTTLFIGGVGLMNILVVSVNERTREIGVRRALGATRRLIMLQFLAEAVTITLVAGSIGVGVAVLIRFLMGLLPLPPLFTPPALPWSRVIGVYAFMTLVGIVAGLAPARRAAAIDPAVALRYE